jgi:7-cyano-7-deazaguanine synthase
MKKSVVLFSGGVESTCVLYLKLLEGHVVYPVYVKCGMPWERLEYAKATELWQDTKRRFSKLMPIRVLSLKTYHKKSKAIETEDELFIPLRNLTLLTAVAGYALSKRAESISIGSLGLYPFPDNNLAYLREVERLITEGSKQRLKIEVPLFGMEKGEVVKRFSKWVPLHQTFSCVNPILRNGKVLHCGRCIKCKEREEAFKEAQIPL